MELESEFMRTVEDRVPSLLILSCGAMAPVLASEFVHIMSKWLQELFRSLTYVKCIHTLLWKYQVSSRKHALKMVRVCVSGNATTSKMDCVTLISLDRYYSSINV